MVSRAQQLLWAWRDMRRTTRYQLIWEHELFQTRIGNGRYSEPECFLMVHALRNEGTYLRKRIQRLRKIRRKAA